MHGTNADAKSSTYAFLCALEVGFPPSCQNLPSPLPNFWRGRLFSCFCQKPRMTTRFGKLWRCSKSPHANFMNTLVELEVGRDFVNKSARLSHNLTCKIVTSPLFYLTGGKEFCCNVFLRLL
jgi:hypothetical protein